VTNFKKNKNKNKNNQNNIESNSDQHNLTSIRKLEQLMLSWPIDFHLKIATS
jgi:hypothetical protein